MLTVFVEDRPVSALIDTGCSRSVLSKAVVGSRGTSEKNEVTMMNGDVVTCERSFNCEVFVNGRIVRLGCLVSDILHGVDMLLGMDAISLLGGVSIAAGGRVVEFPQVVAIASAPDVRIVDTDFEAVFVDGAWTVSWKWSNEDQSPVLKNHVSQYSMSGDVESAFSKEVERWIEEGWLQEYNDAYCGGLVPLMAVVQTNKDKIRPVLDFRELNSFVSSHTGQSQVCGEKLRKWRRLGTALSIVDLRNAYLQVRVHKDLWKYQIVEYKGQRYALTRLGFGLNVAPKIMSAIVNKVLSADPQVCSGSDSYVDDIIVNEDVVSVQRVVELLKKFGLECKSPEKLSGSRVLGLSIFESDGKLFWKRDNVLQEPTEEMTKRDVFSFCGKLIGHFPVASWLRPACSYVKRLSNDVNWDSKISENVHRLVSEIWCQVSRSDPVKGVWYVPDCETGRVYCDASNLAIGVCLRIAGNIVEDNCWLRKPEDVAHINLAELDAVLKGVNLAVTWNIKKLEVVTDSNTVFNWLRSIIFDDHRVKTRGLSEVLVRRRLSILSDIINECDLKIDPILVPTNENPADRLTRVPKQWLKRDTCFVVDAAPCEERNRKEKIRQVHEVTHCGVEKTIHLINCADPDLTPSYDEVKSVISECAPCSSIDPSPVRWDRGNLSVEGVWTRIGIDVTHHEGKRYLTFIDCGPSRYAIWRSIPNEEASTIAARITEVFCEFGVPNEILLDNAPSFKSREVKTACEQWKVDILYRSAHRPSGNAIIERHHRTVKRMAARTREDVRKMAFYYNFLPTDAGDIPYRVLFGRSPRCPLREPRILNEDGAPSIDYNVGDVVFVKPSRPDCTTEWSRGRVTAITSRGAVEVDGVHRHVGDIRPVPRTLDMTSDSVSDASDPDDQPRRSTRVSALPWRYDSLDS